jgi:hypothetical protein
MVAISPKWLLCPYHAPIGNSPSRTKRELSIKNGACRTTYRRRLPRLPRPDELQTGDNVGMEAGELVAKILAAISSGRDLYLYDQYIIGPDARQRAREVLIEKRDACSDPDKVAFLTSVIRGLEEGRG